MRGNDIATFILGRQANNKRREHGWLFLRIFMRPEVCALLIQQQLVQVGSNRDISITTKLFGDGVQQSSDNRRPGRVQEAELIWIKLPRLSHIFIDDRLAAFAEGSFVANFDYLFGFILD